MWRVASLHALGQRLGGRAVAFFVGSGSSAVAAAAAEDAQQVEVATVARGEQCLRAAQREFQRTFRRNADGEQQRCYYVCRSIKLRLCSAFLTALRFILHYAMMGMQNALWTASKYFALALCTVSTQNDGQHCGNILRLRRRKIFKIL